MDSNKTNVYRNTVCLINGSNNNSQIPIFVVLQEFVCVDGQITRIFYVVPTRKSWNLQYI